MLGKQSAEYNDIIGINKELFPWTAAEFVQQHEFEHVERSGHNGLVHVRIEEDKFVVSVFEIDLWEYDGTVHHRSSQLKQWNPKFRPQMMLEKLSENTVFQTAFHLRTFSDSPNSVS